MKKHFRIVAAVFMLPALVSAATNVWDGGGADDDLTTDDNWVSDAAPVPGSSNELQFAGSTRTTPFNDFAVGSDFGSIVFNAGAASFFIGGNGFDVFSQVLNSSTNPQSINNLKVTLGSNVTVDADAGNLSIGADVDGNGFTLSVVGAETTTLSGAISGADKIRKEGDGTLVLTASNSYSGGISIGRLFETNGGTTILMDGDAVGTGQILYERDGTVALGADALTVPNYVYVPNWGGGARVIRFDLPGYGWAQCCPDADPMRCR